MNGYDNDKPIVRGIDDGTTEPRYRLRPLKPRRDVGIFNSEELINDNSICCLLSAVERGAEPLMLDLSWHVSYSVGYERLN